MPRDKNGEEEKKRINEEQKKGDNISKDIDIMLNGQKVNIETRQKIRLYKEQDCKCMYSGESIDLNTLINDKYAYEIDHIIPISISFNDSFNNKVIVKRSENQKKGQRTPYQYFKTKENTNWNYNDFKSFVLSLPIPKRKKESLLYEKDINKYEIRKEFINRNLVDTRYASRGILNTLQDYFNYNDIKTKVHTIKGAATSIFRKKAQIDKNRDEDYRDHAIDALVIAGIKKMNYLNKLINIKIYDENTVYSETTGEIITLENEKDFYDSEFIKFITSLRDIKVKYSHKIDKKFNRSISNQTIFSTRNFEEIDYIIKKYKNIYDTDGEKVAELFKKNGAQKLLMFKHDKESFDLLSQIVNQYKNEKNPFLKYYQDNGDYIRKRNKKGLGPIIKSLKCIDKKLVSHIPISHKYPESKNKKVVLLSINPFRIDVYKEKNGIYKFLKIDHFQIKNNKGKNYIDQEKYNEEKKIREISKDAEFMFSLNKGDLFYYNKGDEKAIVRYVGTNYNANKIEHKPINRNLYEKERNILTVGQQVKDFYKVNCDVLGNLYRVEKESCKFEL